MTESDESSSNEPPPRSPAAPRGDSGRCPSDPPEAAEVDVIDPTGRLGSSGSAELSAVVARACEVLGARGEVRIRVVADAQMRRLHAERLGDESTTDVLTFDLREHSREGAVDHREPLDVDIVLCIDEAERRAAEFGHGGGAELALYAVHGVLHCLGHDDHEVTEAERMHAEEDRVLRAIGVGAIYRPGGEPATAEPTGGGSA